MSMEPIGNRDPNIAAPLFKTRVRFNVANTTDKIETQVVDVDADRVLRQMPIENSSQLLRKLYA
jgi:uncharacterized FlaG/YvyC family protein